MRIGDREYVERSAGGRQRENEGLRFARKCSGSNARGSESKRTYFTRFSLMR